MINRVWFLYSSLNMGIFLRRSHSFIIIKTKINKSPLQIMLTVICQSKIGLNYGTNYNAGLKQDFDVRVGSSIGFRIFSQVINRVGNIADFGHK